MKRFFKVIAIFMVVILCVGSISTLFDIGSDEPTGPGDVVERPGDHEEPDAPDEPEEPDEPTEPEEPSCTHVDADDNFLCDKCSESFSDGQDLFGGTVINNLTFSDDVSKNVFENTETGASQGYSLGGITAGVIQTNGGYLNYKTTSEDVLNYSDKASQIYFGIHNDTRKGFVQPVEVSTFDYMTIDFDVSTDTQYFSRTAFKLQGKDSAGATYNEDTYFEIIRDNNAAYLSVYNGGRIDICEIMDRTHITLVICIDHDNLESSKIKLYIDGEYKAIKAYSSEMESLIYLRAYFGAGFVEENCSMNFDNFTVSTFGSGDGAYSGALEEAINNTSINLTECADSVLFHK